MLSIQMTQTYKGLLGGLIAVAILGCNTACSSDNNGDAPPAQKAVTFGSTIDSRAVASWTAGQTIGVFMKQAGQPLATQAILGGVANSPFVTSTGSGFFKAVAGNVYYPTDAVVDFVAYSPYNAAVTDFQVPVDVTDQSTPTSLDLLYANNATAWSATMMEASLQFSPQMAVLRLNLNASDNSDLGAVVARVLNVPTKSTFDLRTGTFANPTTTGEVDMLVNGTGSSRTASAYLIPTATPAQVELTYGTGHKDTISILRPLTRGAEIIETVRLSASGSTTSAGTYRSWMETPLITATDLAKSNLRYVTHFLTESGYASMRNYSMLYDTDLKMAHWVAYPLTRSYMTKGVSRTDAWGLDPAFTSAEQAVLFNAVSGYQRGHQIPSADRYITRSANVQTFYFTNMTPQIGSLNGGIWGTLESALRSWAGSVDTLYVVTGASATTPTDANVQYALDNDGKRIAVPKYYYKAICAINRSTGVAKTLAFKLDHKAYPSSATNYMSYAISVQALEQLTGYTFFPEVPSQYKTSTTW